VVNWEEVRRAGWISKLWQLEGTDMMNFNSIDTTYDHSPERIRKLGIPSALPYISSRFL
jgi:hypothetical protein